jgi:hypothetical protein
VPYKASEETILVVYALAKAILWKCKKNGTMNMERIGLYELITK